MTLEETLASMIATTGASLYDIEIRKEGDNVIYCVMVQAQDGVSLDLCESISRLISPILDVTPPMSCKYFLEVSSPGIERKLKSLTHVQKSLGENAKFTLKSGDKVEGKILNIEGDTIMIEHDATTTSLSWDDVSRAKTIFEW